MLFYSDDDYEGLSAPELVRMLGRRFKEYRLVARLTQKEVAEKTALSVLTIHRFESGIATNIALSTFLLLLKAVGCVNDMKEVLPEQPPNPYLLNDQNKKIQRIRHKKS